MSRVPARRWPVALALLLVAHAGTGGIACAAAAAPAPVPPSWPGESLYQLPVPLEASDGHRGTLADAAGKPVLVTMFYAECNSACPLLVESLRALERGLAPEARARLQVVMVSFDATRDDPARLVRFAAMHRVAPGRWTLARSDAEGTRQLAAALAIRYRRLADGNYNHASVVALLDARGVPVARAEGLGPPDAAFLVALRAQLTAASTP